MNRDDPLPSTTRGASVGSAISLVSTMRQATRVIETGEKPEQFKSGRECKDKFCDTILTVYNPNDKCWIHAPARKFHNRGRIER